MSSKVARREECKAQQIPGAAQLSQSEQAGSPTGREDRGLEPKILPPLTFIPVHPNFGFLPSWPKPICTLLGSLNKNLDIVW